MPAVPRIGGCRFFYCSNENGEPAHIHVQYEKALAKFWLKPVAYARSSGFFAHELTTLNKLVEENQQIFLEAWNEFFSR
ncbi:DUF4160 domain-containing protein [Methylomonas sp. SURF-2]|uniref:DUF4160 domain-containing protein n=1 Tax=Methylomonas subterranea TaxID=2952225 RepID=A0ABT1TER2_9GAMM|nr:DUF4160 domain-containing protein [Methylomonas sp. SURF-2]MCQ8103779.1 DUF4160 domain-containing protein [Methylomonas sp. SURF-2]